MWAFALIVLARVDIQPALKTFLCGLRAGLPGINLAQDPIEYQTHTWHTNLDTYERVVEQDVKQCAIVVASLAYHLAMREEMLPRFPPDSMPMPDK